MRDANSRVLAPGHAPVAQGFVFAVYVYGAALVRAGGAKFISFYLVRSERFVAKLIADLVIDSTAFSSPSTESTLPSSLVSASTARGFWLCSKPTPGELPLWWSST